MAHDIHAHKCGFDPHGPDHGRGCAHIFTHEAPPKDAPLDQCTSAHMCPGCGRGPWTYKWTQLDEDRYNVSGASDRGETVTQLQLIRALLALLTR